MTTPDDKLAALMDAADDWVRTGEMTPESIREKREAVRAAALAYARAVSIAAAENDQVANLVRDRIAAAMAMAHAATLVLGAQGGHPMTTTTTTDDKLAALRSVACDLAAATTLAHNEPQSHGAKVAVMVALEAFDTAALDYGVAVVAAFVISMNARAAENDQVANLVRDRIAELRAEDAE